MAKPTCLSKRRPTGVRDYIQVMDLAQGNVPALVRLFEQGDSFTINLGTGQGYSVLDVIREFEAASLRKVPYEIVGRPPGDIASCHASPDAASTLLRWRSNKGLREMCEDTWRRQSTNPNGHEAAQDG